MLMSLLPGWRELLTFSIYEGQSRKSLQPKAITGTYQLLPRPTGRKTTTVSDMLLTATANSTLASLGHPALAPEALIPGPLSWPRRPGPQTRLFPNSTSNARGGE